MQNVPQMQAARIRLYGAKANDVAADPGPTADALLAEFAEVADEKASPMEEGKRLTSEQFDPEFAAFMDDLMAKSPAHPQKDRLAMWVSLLESGVVA